ncbi:unnamed protein product [Paramecium sonneborni]|uniref:Uncharacterized protein n=1 Tax=Paramecium sonneborni TaxID=65129 RepID=A0A8S1NUY2_9CILI|nr:unnamed protein product [Paramecium sonneborni]
MCQVKDWHMIQSFIYEQKILVIMELQKNLGKIENQQECKIMLLIEPTLNRYQGLISTYNQYKVYLQMALTKLFEKISYYYYQIGQEQFGFVEGKKPNHNLLDQELLKIAIRLDGRKCFKNCNFQKFQISLELLERIEVTIFIEQIQITMQFYLELIMKIFKQQNYTLAFTFITTYLIQFKHA